MKKTLPVGGKFPLHTGMEEPREMYKKETNRKAGEGLPAHMARKGWEPLQKIGKSSCRPHGTMRNRMLRAADGLRDAGRPGPARRHATGQLVGLKEDPAAGPQAHGLGPGPWTGKPAAGRVPGRYKAGHVPRTMQEPLHGTGFGRVRPRPGHPKATTGADKKASKKSRPASRVPPQQGLRDPGRRRGLVHTGLEPLARMAPPGPACGRARHAPAQQVHPIGALRDGAPYCRFCGKPSTEDCTGFLTGACRVQQARDIPGQRPVPQAKGAEKVPQKDGRWGGGIKTCCFPPHAPEPNPAGAQWKPSERRRGTACTGARGDAGVHQCNAAGEGDSDCENVQLPTR